MTPFHDLHDYMALPRLTGLRLAPDGSWLAASVSALSADRRTFKPSIWRIPAGPAQARPAEPANPADAGLAGRAVRLTRSAEGEDNPAFLPDGSLVFLSARPAPPPGHGPSAEGSACRPARPAPQSPAAPGDGAGPEAGAVAAPGGRRGGVPAHRAARRHLPAGHRRGRAAGRVHLPGAARRQRHRRRRAAAEEPGRRRGDRDPARGRPGPALGPRPGPGPAPPAGHRGGPGRR